MRKIITSNIEQCRCGTRVARLWSQRSQKHYSVEIRGEQAGEHVEVGVADFHNCKAERDAAPSFASVVAFFRAAIAKGAKRMTVTVESADAVIAVSFKDGRGVLYVTDGQPYGQSRYFGALDLADGRMRRGRDNMTAYQAQLWNEFVADPVKTAALSGHLTGRCSFCSRHLDDSRSVQHGYGPVCAEKFGMPWNAARVA